eukprot:gb/GECH01014834.1/.p1 GENE.gb/GECH01014834.1/~~gb/GECH01014834.1/.p1  ORF type:complete len:755 (+),score=178.27 gb/GECH01014834.1/:1-2265(+)
MTEATLTIRNQCVELLKNTVQSKLKSTSKLSEEILCDIDSLSEELVNIFSGKANEESRYNIIEFAFRIALQQLIDQNTKDTEVSIFLLIDISFKAFTNASHLCKPHLPILLLSDLCDASSIHKCEEVFQYMQLRRTHLGRLMPSRSSYKEAARSKLTLLYMCNKLLSRISRTENHLFRARVHLYLSHLLPFFEPSALNGSHEYNTDIKTEIEDDDNDDDNTQNESNINYQMYQKFWKLQKYTTDPQLLLDRREWQSFCSSIDTLISAFKSTEIIDSNTKKNHNTPSHVAEMDTDSTTSERSNSDDMDVQKEGELFIPKYLTSKRLFNMQLRDPKFRRQLLFQTLILFQDTNSLERFVQQKLSADQLRKIEEYQQQISEMLSSVPPHGDKILQAFRRILSREENMVNWKVDKCPPPDGSEDRVPSRQQKPELSLALDTEASSSALKALKTTTENSHSDVSMKDESHGESLSSNDPYNIAEALVEFDKNIGSRKPSIDEHLTRFREQLDPDEGIEEEFWLSRNEVYVWRAMRLLMRSRLVEISKKSIDSSIFFNFERMLDFLDGKIPHTDGDSQDSSITNKENGNEEKTLSSSEPQPFEDTSQEDRSLDSKEHKTTKEYAKEDGDEKDSSSTTTPVNMSVDPNEEHSTQDNTEKEEEDEVRSKEKRRHRKKTRRNSDEESTHADDNDEDDINKDYDTTSSKSSSRSKRKHRKRKASESRIDPGDERASKRHRTNETLGEQDEERRSRRKNMRRGRK